MGEYQGRINVPKDTMLHVVNGIFNQEIKESTTKENILKLIPEIYVEENLQELITMLPYDSYKTLERLLQLSESDDINKFIKKLEYKGIHYLEEAMIIVMRAKHLEYNYSLNAGVIEQLKPLFMEENKKLAKRYKGIEELTIGLLYTYGVVDIDFLRESICRHTNEIISEDTLYNFYFKRLKLNTFVNYYDVRWTDTKEIESFITYLDENEVNIGDIIVGRNSRKLEYKKFSKDEILERKEYIWNSKVQKLYDFINRRNDRIWTHQLERILKKSELGENILQELTDKCMFRNDNEVTDFMELYMDWYNNSPQYMLGGYTPKELSTKYLKQ